MIQQATTGEDTASQQTLIPIFDFTKPETIDQIDRLDDAVMGGISTSTVQPGDNLARWVGVCRTDGGGFCGFRTNPFEQPLVVGDNDGMYVSCRLVSDDEPQRRVWKVTTRTKPDRGELLYQAPFNLTAASTTDNAENEWTVVKVPFDSFRYVRGPRLIPDAPPLNTTGGLYQIGLSMSKFRFGANTTELDNFRDGFFELQLKEIGLYKDQSNETETKPSNAGTAPKVLSKLEAQRKRPLLLKMLLPLAKLFFSEQSQRRKSAMRILREERKLSRGGAILWGLRSRARSFGIVPSLTKTISILAVDAFRTIVSASLKIALVYPIRMIRKGASLVGGKKKELASSRE